MSGALEKLVSGGQTGVDRAALDVGMALGLAVGGWCPRGRRAEDGPIAMRYPLRETHSRNYAVRTAWNVRDSDATLILSSVPATGGTRLTLKEARRQGRPVLVLDLASPDVAAFERWLETHRPRVLNVAGPRESDPEGVYQAARSLLVRLLQGHVRTMEQAG